jgi:hypothetical protein
MTVSEGYRDGLAGRKNTNSSPDYVKGWEAGWRQRVLAWNSTSKPTGDA